MTSDRNRPCPCGSGKKAKKCCRTQDKITAKLQEVRSYHDSIEVDEIKEEIRRQTVEDRARRSRARFARTASGIMLALAMAVILFSLVVLALGG